MSFLPSASSSDSGYKKEIVENIRRIQKKLIFILSKKLSIKPILVCDLCGSEKLVSVYKPIKSQYSIEVYLKGKTLQS